ncbi:MAG: DUF3169 family protein [Clostridium sp.]|uniref:DUF3169 family protein n=1 Tax=Clostridium sp. TaxID=1506 RepID=UPI003D6C762E
MHFNYLFVINLIYIRTNYKKINLDEIPKNIERKIAKVINYSTVQVVLGLTWEAIVINKNFDRKLSYLVIFPTMVIFVGALLQSITIKYYNYLYPNRKLNIFENKAEEKFFQKLDEGEKWVTFNCSYTTFKKMQLVYAAIIVICIILSIIIDVPMILPIVVGILWIIQISIYMFEEKKYEE